MRAVLERGWCPDAVLLAGHAHGGQIVVPGFGPSMKRTRAPRWLPTDGMFEREGSWLGVSRGTGMERAGAPRIRRFSRPQLMVLDLEETR